MTPLTTTLSWLLHHANCASKASEFYDIKTRLLKKHGRFVEHQVQYLEGKKCWSCGGTGIHHYYYDYGEPTPDPCWDCINGWYKRPTWVILKRIRFGRYYFHQPIHRCYEKPRLPVSISGYVDHEDTRYGQFALLVSYLLYNRKVFRAHLKKWYLYTGMGWRLKWWLPRNWVNNIMHIIKKKHKAMPFRALRRHTHATYDRYFGREVWESDLPF